MVRWKLEQMGVEFATRAPCCQVRRDRPLRPINVITSPYPGFATDLQSPIMALACLAEGVSYIRETIFDGRYTLVGELVKMGASVELDRRRGGGARPVRLPAPRSSRTTCAPAPRWCWPGWPPRARR